VEPHLTQPAGLCARCVHARVITSAKGSTFVLCGKSATDLRFAKYPALPVVGCDGFVDAASAQGNHK
jgi:hypothetical protein